MAFDEIRKQLKSVVEDEDNRVIALSGAWGTGKTHLWNELKCESSNSQVKNAIYASLFGLNDIPTFKIKLAEQVLANNPSSKLSSALGTFNKSRPILQKMFPKTSILEELSLLAAPKLLEGKFVVLDDIERKSSKLHIDQVLGFIDEHINNHGVRFLIIMNTERLDDYGTWELLREKVVDHEIQLRSSPKEAFEIANRNNLSIYPETVEKSIDICRITNIRIVEKVIKAVNLILRDHNKLPDSIMERVIPAAVLLAGAHYKGIPSGPTVEFILNPEKPRLDKNSKERMSKEQVIIEEEKQMWCNLIQDLGLRSPDAYEPLVADYLASGMVDKKNIDATLSRYEESERIKSTHEKLDEFIESTDWGLEGSDAELLKGANEFEGVAHHLDATGVSLLAEKIGHLSDGHDLSERVIHHWIKKNVEGKGLVSPYYHMDKNRLHPLIFEALEGKRVGLESTEDLTIHGICTTIVFNKGWTPLHEEELNKKSVDDFKSEISQSNIKERKLILTCMFRMVVQFSDRLYTNYFPAINTFKKFCHDVSSGDDGRLKTIITREMGSVGMEYFEGDY